MRKLLIRCLVGFLFITSMLLPSVALAMTQSEWNQKCRYKAGASITLYGWYEIEYDGMHGYVIQKFLTIDE